MPSEIRTDENYWQPLSEREIVQEPINNRYGKEYSQIFGFAGPRRVARPFKG